MKLWDHPLQSPCHAYSHKYFWSHLSQTSSSLEAVTATIQDKAVSLSSAGHSSLLHGAEGFHGPPVSIPPGDLSSPAHLDMCSPWLQHGLWVSSASTGWQCQLPVMAAWERWQPQQGLVMIQGISPQPAGRRASFCGQTAGPR